MTEHIEALLHTLRQRDYRKNRRPVKLDLTDACRGMDPFRRDVFLLKTMLEEETPLLFDGDTMGFNRTLRHVPFYCDEQGNRISRDAAFGNIVPDYGRVLSRGFDSLLEEVRAGIKGDDHRPFYESVATALEAALAFADRYRDAAKAAGCQKLYEALCRVPHQPPTTFHEACVCMKFYLFTLRCNRNAHVTLGRFDQYMYPYYLADRSAGVSEEALFETLEEFFVSINFDTDLYTGIQQGDNGQSLVLGGYSKAGEDMYNALSALCMQASLELNLIDPKINLRVSKKTPMERLEQATRLTRQGLGFPQYCNDDVAVPGLISLGYKEEDAYNYAVAACWEYIVSGTGADIPNLLVMNFPKVIETAVQNHLRSCATFTEFLRRVKEEIVLECDRIVAAAPAATVGFRGVSPYMSVFVRGCLEKGLDVTAGGAAYNNYGIHGAGISTAADSLVAVKLALYDEAICTADELLAAIKADFEGYAPLRNRLLAYPKMGNNDDTVDQLASEIMQTFAQNMNGRPNDVGGVFRAGTGSAMEYVRLAALVGATPDGRKAGQPYGSSFSPSITAKLAGPLSCIQSFTKFDMTKIINGGPLTMEVHDTVFRNEDGIHKVACLVKCFIDQGGHQLQLNSINRDRLLDAQQHPENYPNLIVRVWGWSGYFNELDPEYQNHIIRRAEFLC